eukprot:TRINITY_DN9194_c0_g1_i1.p1 TRINITY_DN9194_c0_g1~~TRINITY_DN9194_c0_g1_i1.p1  ORF type:complete len:320 (+),score=45.13 TRINITY_DN9194_c0_g1_i1:398-1357(+)
MANMPATNSCTNSFATAELVEIGLAIPSWEQSRGNRAMIFIQPDLLVCAGNMADNKAGGLFVVRLVPAAPGFGAWWEHKDIFPVEAQTGTPAQAPWDLYFNPEDEILYAATESSVWTVTGICSPNPEEVKGSLLVAAKDLTLKDGRKCSEVIASLHVNRDGIFVMGWRATPDDSYLFNVRTTPPTVWVDTAVPLCGMSKCLRPAPDNTVEVNDFLYQYRCATNGDDRQWQDLGDFTVNGRNDFDWYLAQRIVRLPTGELIRLRLERDVSVADICVLRNTNWVPLRSLQLPKAVDIALDTVNRRLWLLDQGSTLSYVQLA